MQKKAGTRTLANDRDASEMALLVLDLVSTWDFPDGQVLLQRAMRIATKVARLRARCRQAGVPTIFANDNHGHWRSDFRHVVAASLERGGGGAAITELLSPHETDYAVLKPRHSAFFATPLELLLDHLGVRRLVVVGVSADQCVLQTVADARMRELDVVVASDCIASLDRRRELRALEHFERVLDVPTRRGQDIRPARRLRANAA